MTDLEKAACILMIMAGYSKEAEEFARKCDEQNKEDEK